MARERAVAAGVRECVMWVRRAAAVWWERRLETAGRREVTTISLLPVTVATAPAAIAPPLGGDGSQVIVRVPGSVTVEIEGATPAWAGELIAALARVVVILPPRAVKVYVATAPVNLRKSFDGLSNEIRAVLGHDPLSGHVFVFVNRRPQPGQAAGVDPRRVHDRAQATRAGNVRVPGADHRGGDRRKAIDAHELAMLLEGIDDALARTSPRWEPPLHTARAS
ncbi:MAG: IS66 family insertion sequence element accessory protein TnpB [Kofleriaceae bacterium]|nr:IS66 family insertion sequence element accessory protein TnpB [Kofleriaceae bacterium]